MKRMPNIPWYCRWLMGSGIVGLPVQFEFEAQVLKETGQASSYASVVKCQQCFGSHIHTYK